MHVLEMYGCTYDVHILWRSRSILLKRVGNVFFFIPSIAKKLSIELFAMLLKSHGLTNHDFKYVSIDRKRAVWESIVALLPKWGAIY
jgi:hypothetical protein